MSTQIMEERPLFEIKLLDNVVIPATAVDLRTRAMDIFLKTGFPTRRQEDWRYTDLLPWLKKDWTLEPDTFSIPEQWVTERLIAGLDANIMVFINGRFSEAHSHITEQDPEIVITSLSRAAKTHPHLYSSHFGHYAPFEKSGIAALNTALAEDGLFVYVPDGRSLSAPLHALYFHTGEKAFIQCRNLVIAGENSSAGIIEGIYDISGNTFSNTVTEVYAGRHAVVHYVKLQEGNETSAQVNLTHFHQESDSLCNSYTYSLSGRLLRNDLNYTLVGKKGEAHLYGLYIPTGEEHFDNHTFVDHAVPGCFSNELFKGVMNGRSTAVFNGKILVRPDAQKTNAYQSNKNVLLSPEAKVDTKPQLEIFADDVKCSHGATVGQLNEEAIFYLRSRGIDEHTSRTMLTFAFAEETLDNIPWAPLKSFLEEKIEARLAQGL